ncbi:MAG: response regulator transcription factor [Paludibacter sp.]|jgi:DNA-binding NarL/FixJ family response regulator|nr:response regulator transcription factor [Paludibacter sp.]
MNETLLKIAIAEPSVIIRSGLAAALKRMSGFHVQTFELTTNSMITNYLHIHKPDILIINPVFWGTVDIEKIRKDSNHRQLQVLALLSSVVDKAMLRAYDDTVSLFDNIEQLAEKITRLNENPNTETPNDEGETLSAREKEILKCVVKGMTNKEIAQTLFLSAHTVITHRRNIVRKLEIHSTAGLTVYAIVNKLVELDEIKKDL